MGGKIVNEALIGKYVTLREVRVEDADFILKLRCDDKKSRFLHKTDYNLEKQQSYIRHYLEIQNEWYFIAEDKNGARIGTYRIYDVQGDSFCIGSWLMADGVSAEQSFETDYLVRLYGFNILGFNKIHFDVRKGNKKVWRYHMSLGAKRSGETELDYLWEVTKEDYLKKALPMCSAMGIK
ncbi:MAG: GNAT family N-acetyltransferase [Spirochaetales bacterium]|nr:GNAT family N-acetyltransferase [Spirochaetales bacterium]